MTLCPILGGEPYDSYAPVITWHDHGFELQAGVGHQYARGDSPIRHHVVHYTGGEGTLNGSLADTLEANGYGYHFVIELDGTVMQTCDPSCVVAAGSGWNNRWAVQTAFVSRGKPHVPSRGVKRRRYRATVHGREQPFVRLSPAQVGSFLALQETLHEAYGIQHHLPHDADGQLYTTTLPRSVARTWRGVLGHFHLSGGKVDPGTDLFEALIALGF